MSVGHLEINLEKGDHNALSKNGKILQSKRLKSTFFLKIILSFIIVEFSFHAEKKKFIVWRSENLFSCPRAGKQAVFQL